MANKRIVQPYATACAWVSSRPSARAVVSRVRACAFRRIAQLPPVYGRTLDELQAPLYLVRWIAMPGSGRAALREQRYRAARDMLERGPLTRARWEELQDSQPSIQRTPPAHRLAKVSPPAAGFAHALVATGEASRSGAA